MWTLGIEAAAAVAARLHHVATGVECSCKDAVAPCITEEAISTEQDRSVGPRVITKSLSTVIHVRRRQVTIFHHRRTVGGVFAKTRTQKNPFKSAYNLLLSICVS